MKINYYKSTIYILILSIFCLIQCTEIRFTNFNYSFVNNPSANYINDSTLKDCNNFEIKSKALLSSRFKNLAQLKNVISIQYANKYTKSDSNSCLNSLVTLCYVSNNENIIRKMSSGVSQNELLKLQNSNYLNKTIFALKNLSIISHRKELEKVYILARRKIEVFGPGDVSFYDLALASFRHINTPNLAYLNTRDSSEKGFINTFNHVTAQALITYLFSESLADLIGDLHERNNMPEITSGKFSERQLKDSLNNPEDNYIDIINNEIGQRIGLSLKKKFNLSENLKFTPIMLTEILNDIQCYYMWALEIGLDNFRPSDDIVIKFSNKINFILN